MKLIITSEKTNKKNNQNLLLSIKKFFVLNQESLGSLTSVQVENTGEGFTTTRVRVVIANALAYALGIPVHGTKGKTLKKKGIEIVQPLYSQPPNITTKK